MIGDPVIWVLCDTEGCGYEENDISLTATARGYDERNVESDLESRGWLLEGDKQYCPECAAARSKEPAE